MMRIQLNSDSTIRDGDETESADVTFICRAIRSDEAAPEGPVHGYFIELPPDGLVTVNNRTYHHESQEEGAGGTPGSPFIIGPLNRFTIVELLSQPIFFFRVHEDLDNNADNVLAGANNKVTPAEIARRDTHSGADNANVEVLWTPVNTAPTVELALPSNDQNLDEHDPDVQNHIEQSLDDQDSGKQNLDVINPGEKGNNKEESDQENPDNRDSSVEDSDQGDSDKDSSEDPKSSNSDQGVQYNDEWAVGGKTIDEQHRYYLDELQVFLRDRQQNTLIPRVLASINDRQKSQAGFSIEVDGHVLRPGRTLITNLQHPDNTHQVILVVSIQPRQPVHNITVHVLDVTA